MTQDEARAHLEGMRNDKRGQAESLRRLGDDYRVSANATEDHSLRSQHFESSSRLYGAAREMDREAEAIDIVLQERA